MKILTPFLFCLLLTNCLAQYSIPRGSSLRNEPTPYVSFTIVKSESEVDEMPVRVPNPKIVNSYPSELLNAGISGEAYAHVVIGTDGKGTECEIIRGSHPEFENAVIKLMPSMRFLPAKKDGQAIACPVVVYVLFGLDDDD